MHLIISLILIASVLPWWWSQRHLESVRILQYPLYSLQNVDLYKLSSLLVLCPMLLWSWLSLIHGKAKYETKLSCTVIYAKRGDKVFLSLFSEIRLSKPKIMITVKLCKRVPAVSSPYEVANLSCWSSNRNQCFQLKRKTKWDACLISKESLCYCLTPPPPLCCVSLDTLLRFCPIYMVIPLNNCSLPSSTTARFLLFIPSIHHDTYTSVL